MMPEEEAADIQPPLSPVHIEGDEEGPAVVAAVTSENWSTRTNDVMEILKSEFASAVKYTSHHFDVPVS